MAMFTVEHFSILKSMDSVYGKRIIQSMSAHFGGVCAMDLVSLCIQTTCSS
ncbi:unnamed protein product [Hymenolepis diminuta]|uniref:Uncharacterized protein n=1 Tax=Hymenolepis diminuta TaxID=6216 RepID=A0A564Z7C2_HYMDI|nr:unnamed protein product [Hymenolepis diminuta]